MGIKALALCFGFVLICVGIGIGLWFHLKGKDFSQVILQRCKSYNASGNPELRDRDCQQIVEAFTKAFVSKDPCKITWEDYAPLLQLTKQALPCDKIFLWSKTKGLVEELQQKQKNDLFLMRDTLIGHMADNLKWCGKEGSSEINTESCQKNNCEESPVDVFWKVASKWFAENVCGVVGVLLSGSVSQAFNRNSIFGSVEVPNLKRALVTKLQTWVIHNKGGDASDSCSGSSISELEKIVRERGIVFTCKDIQSLDQIDT
ncbi:ADP-ribosyl cyclase/cyclic ADP-ribose hydrolase 1-like [Erinaceus europaeus]|uniref:ADP-ribosyl cyclase/cyclic ADP-ribose hydrolase 1 n=1 Tax=Erinaceus europaeus TaxID=9365 RepID=A0A1S3W4U9_ERIEU|nr:ADP-ribosyl cyclase/cyclic ADP-ribose hydrolase 1-like [Erinaceus europaeus]